MLGHLPTVLARYHGQVLEKREVVVQRLAGEGADIPAVTPRLNQHWVPGLFAEYGALRAVQVAQSAFSETLDVLNHGSELGVGFDLAEGVAAVVLPLEVMADSFPQFLTSGVVHFLQLNLEVGSLILGVRGLTNLTW